MDKHQIRPCPVCAYFNADHLYTVRMAVMDDVPLAGTYDVVSCVRCKAAFADTPSTQSAYDDYYARHSKYEDVVTGTGDGSDPTDAKRLIYAAAKIEAFCADRSSRIVDIGCANGGLLSALAALGYTSLTGIDPSSSCAKTTGSRAGITGLVGSFNRLPKPQHPYDLVILTGVLEHVLDVSQAIEAIGEILAPSGQVYIGVPDASRYSDYLFAPFQDFSLEHINHFSACSLTSLMSLKGYGTVFVERGTVPAPPAFDAPTVFGLFERSGRSTGTTEIVPDTELTYQITRYIDLCTPLMDRLAEQVYTAFDEHQRLIVWGTGQLALKLVALPGLPAERIVALVDSNPVHHHSRLLDLMVSAPETVAGMTEPILIMTTMHQEPITRTIREGLLLNNPVITLSLHAD